MESKNKFWKGVLVGALVTAFAALVVVGISSGIWVVAQGMMMEKASESGPGVEQASDLDLDSVEAKLGLLEQTVDSYFLFDKDQQKMEDGIYAGFMAGLEDPYTVYYNREQLAEMMEDTTGKYCGIGVMVSQSYETGIITVLRVFEDAPGFEAGMMPGDVIVKVDGKEVAGQDLDMVVRNQIKGEENTDVTITVMREGETEPMDLRVTRRQVEVPTVSHQMLEGNTGYLSVTQFDEVTVEQFRAAIDELEQAGMERLVIDLRNNPGGVLDSAVDMLAYVLPQDKLEGILVYTEDKDGKGDKYFCKDGKIRQESDYGNVNDRYPKEDKHQVEVPIAVVVNGNSASASEVFAGAIQDYGYGKIVGTTTFGKGIVQTLIPFQDGTAVKLTTSHYYTPGGNDLHKKGVQPDVEVELAEELKKQAIVKPEEDNQIQKAVEALLQ